MAAPSKPVGYECEFVDQVPEDYFCKQCSHVAREPTIASCCTEVFCKACIEAVIEDKKPCPSCQETEISYIPHKKYQPKILALRVHCSLKDRGCEWTGQLQHLDAHLDLTTGDCVYVDVDCPSKCDQKVQKCNVDTHLANHCPNRDYTCPHCSFKATFREVSEHFEVCPYYPLVCPNRCGASFERDVLEDHMKMCSQQMVRCRFSYAGCEAEFTRDHQKEHMEQNIQKHLALVAAATLRISQAFEQSLQEQQQEFDQKLEEQQQAFDQKLEDKDSEIKAIVNNEASQLVNEQRQQSETRIRDLEGKLQEQQQAMEETKKALEEQKEMFEVKLHEQQEEFYKQLEKKDNQIQTLESALNILRIDVIALPYYFTLTNYQEIQSRAGNYNSPLMYTQPGGYKFQLGIYPKGPMGHMSVHVTSTKGDHDSRLKFPVRFTITLELLNQHRDQDHYSRDIQCEVTKEKFDSIGSCNQFISHADMEWNAAKQIQYLKNDSLKFRVAQIL